MATYSQLTKSTFLDAFGTNQYTESQYKDVATGDASKAQDTLAGFFKSGSTDATIGEASSGAALTIALIVKRKHDPTDLLTNHSWAERQAALADQNAVFDKYGADQATYEKVRADLVSVVGQSALDNATGSGFVSSVENRTIWATVDPTTFQDLFGNELLWVDGSTYDGVAWTGDLGLNSKISKDDIGGLWFEVDALLSNPEVKDSTGVTLDPGPLSIGNDAANNGDYEKATPAAIASNYGFPLSSTVETPAIAIIADDVNQQQALFAAYNAYRQEVGLPTVTADEFVVVTGPDGTGQVDPELGLDISTVAGAAPNSTQLLYALLSGTPFAAYQAAFFDQINDPHVLSSSIVGFTQSTAGSPFYQAWHDLFVDGALANVSVHNAAGDQGATGYIYNGIANVNQWQASPFAIGVGGTSIAGRYVAGLDDSLTTHLDAALMSVPATLFSLVAAGLKSLPNTMPDVAPAPPDAATPLATLFETVWQMDEAFVDPNTDQLTVAFGSNNAGSGGIASGVLIPGYQMDFGLSDMTGGKRGYPDVAALADGDTKYAVLNAGYVGDTSQSLLTATGGTSASTPLWAALTAQIDAIFTDQNLPLLGYYNDLLYAAAAIAPASFNDITMGNNKNSFYTTADGPVHDSDVGLDIVPTGNGYEAQAGYDLTTGLGTPNGTILARTLTAIAHSQMSHTDKPPVLDLGASDPTSAVAQSLLFQTVSKHGASVVVSMGTQTDSYTSAASGAQAWTSQLAQQSLQEDFDAALVRLFDSQTQGTIVQHALAEGETLTVEIHAAQGKTVQGTLTTDFGFVDYMVPTGTGTVPHEMVRVARPIAVAETVDALDDQTAIVRLRQDGTDSIALTFYRVDDLLGSVGGLLPGTAGYEAAAAARAYHTDGNETSILGPGYGKYHETKLKDVDSGDLIAMTLVNLTTSQTYWGFSQANETSGGQPVAHLWNYGLNTWGWEDRQGSSSDHDFNDLIVGIDFTSAYGSAWLS